MIAVAIVDQVKDLLARGELSQRTIARRLGISRGTVHAIAAGKRSDRVGRLQPKLGDGGHESSVGLLADFIVPAGLHLRCPGCGGKVQMPCLACYVRSLQQKRGE